MRIALLSDTHVPHALAALPETLLDRLVGVDRILHAGDLACSTVIEQLKRIAPTTAVAGNMDPPELKARLRDHEILRLAGRTIGLAHGHQPHALQDRYIGLDYNDRGFDLFYRAMTARIPDAEIILFGHFHKPVIKEWNGKLFINPGSVAPPHVRPTIALLDLSKEIDVRIVELAAMS